MDTFGWAGAGQHDDVYLPRSVGQVSCGRFELEDAFLGACFGQLHSDSVGGGDAGACHVSSNFGAVGGAVGLASDPLGFFSSGVDVFASVVDGAGAHDGLLDTALAFSRELVEGDGGAVSNGAMLSSYRGTTGGNFYSGESDNYRGGCGHDAEVVSPTSTISPPTPSLPLTTSTQALNPKRKLADDYPTIATALPVPPLPRPGAKRKATTTATSITFGQGAHDPTAGAAGGYEPDMQAMAQVKELVYLAAAMRPVNLGTDAAADKPRRKNVRISSDPQTVAARLRRERVSERLRVLQKLVPGGSKMDTAFSILSGILDRSFIDYVANKGIYDGKSAQLTHRMNFPCRQQKNDELCAIYVCYHMEQIITARKKDPEALNIELDALLANEINTIRGKLCGFIISQIIKDNGEFHPVANLEHHPADADADADADTSQPPANN